MGCGFHCPLSDGMRSITRRVVAISWSNSGSNIRLCSSLLRCLAFRKLPGALRSRCDSSAGRIARALRPSHSLVCRIRKTGATLWLRLSGGSRRTPLSRTRSTAYHRICGGKYPLRSRTRRGSFSSISESLSTICSISARIPTYVEKLEWPRDYWPPTVEPPDDAAWDNSIAACRSDREALARFTKETKLDLTDKIPRGSGQTYLRTILLAVDHASYHIGQIIAVRRLLGAWPAK